MTNENAAVPSGTGTEKLRVHGVCLIEIWKTSRYSAPSVFWREMQADGVMSLWRIMAPNFAKKALAAERFTLEKDGHIVAYAARAFDVRTATLDDYSRVRKLTEAFKSTPDPTLLCPDCWGTKEIQATRVKVDAETQKGIGRERYVCDCPTCAATATTGPGEAIPGTTALVQSAAVQGSLDLQREFARHNRSCARLAHPGNNCDCGVGTPA